MVAFDVGVEQVYRNPPHHDAPRTDLDLASGDRECDQARFAVGAVDPGDRVHRGIDGVVRVTLPAIQADQLIEVPPVIVEADAHQRDAEVGGFLAMVAGEDAEAAGIDRERAV